MKIRLNTHNPGEQLPALQDIPASVEAVRIYLSEHYHRSSGLYPYTGKLTTKVTFEGLWAPQYTVYLDGHPVAYTDEPFLPEPMNLLTPITKPNKALQFDFDRATRLVEAARVKRGLLLMQDAANEEHAGLQEQAIWREMRSFPLTIQGVLDELAEIAADCQVLERAIKGQSRDVTSADTVALRDFANKLGIDLHTLE